MFEVLKKCTTRILCSMPRKPRADANKYKKFASLTYKKHAGNIEANLRDTGYHLDNKLSDREHKVFYNPASKKAVVAYRGTDMRDAKRIWSDLKSDFNIMLGREKLISVSRMPMFNFNKQQQSIRNKGILWIQPAIPSVVLLQHM